MKMVFIVIGIIIIVIVGIWYTAWSTRLRIISPEQARAIAYKAIAGFDAYDKAIPPQVELKGQTYEVTFALPLETAQMSHRSDYAMRVVINARSGSVIKLLIAS